MTGVWSDEKANVAVVDAVLTGGVWENVVTSCAPCNRRKADRLPHQINMHPRVKPRTPGAHIFIQLASPTIPATWRQYLALPEAA